jgi:hypothetical protein
VFCSPTPRMKPISSLWLLGVAVWCTTLWCLAGSARAENVEVATGEQVARWIVELDDNRYSTRERAQFRLEKAGSAAVAEVAQSARTGSLESSTRALNILLAWSEGDDKALRMAALEQIAKLQHRPTEAGLAGKILADAREQATLAKIVELGGRHNIAQQMRGARVVRLGGRIEQPLQVTIGPHWKGTLEDLKLLNQIPRVAVLSLHSAPFGDEVAPVLLDLSHVKRIELYSTKLSDEASEKLQERLSPHVVLDVRGAQLGIGGDPRNGRAQVNWVGAGSAAEKAGLQAGDLITELDGEKVADFSDLVDRVKIHEPGDTVTLKVTRRILKQKQKNEQKERQLEIRVTFDPWGKQPLTPPAQSAVQQFQLEVPGGINIDRR